jgi:cytochrome c553
VIDISSCKSCKSDKSCPKPLTRFKDVHDLQHDAVLSFESVREHSYDGRVRRIYLSALVMLVGVPAFASGAAVPPAGAQLYRRHCVACHGHDGKAKTSKGRFSHARDFTDRQWQTDVTDERIFNSIMNGRSVRGNMPSFADKLNEKQVDSLVTFVRGFKK